MARRLQQTMADYVVIAISPALIMTLVGSLVFFLLTVFYQGEFQERLWWVMACFVFAAVLIGRISIEEGFERAAPFGIALAIVVGIAANSFMEFHGGWIDHFGWLVNWGLIALVWWCAHKLTWDCTMIDDAEDSSGEGLLQVAGIERPDDQRNEPSGPTNAIEGTTSRQVPTGWWQRYVEHQRRPHAPGVWVVYFSLAALPLFGFGQWFIPAAAVGPRRLAFWLLCVYVASGLALLLTTSFLGLRRYLRQRRIEMPTMMANLWLGTGAVVILVLLVVAALLPRPSAEYAISRLPISLGSPKAKSSRYAPVPHEGTPDKQPGPAPARQPDVTLQPDSQQEQGHSDGKQSEGKAGKGDANPKPTESSSTKPETANDQQSSDADDGKAGGQQTNKSGGSGGQSKDQSEPEQSLPQDTNETSERRERAQRIEKLRDAIDRRNQQPPEKDQQQSPPEPAPERDAQEPRPEQSQSTDAEQQPPPKEARQGGTQTEQPAETPPPMMPQVPTASLGVLAQLLQWAFYAVFAMAVLYALWRFRNEVLAAIRGLLAGLRDFWDGLWGRRRMHGALADDEVEIKIPPAPFSTYADPFAAGVASRYSLEELVCYSFEAFEAWSREHGCPRDPDVTPYELAREVARLNASMGADARNVADLYSRAAYARGELPDATRDQLRRLWQSMRQSTRLPQ